VVTLPKGDMKHLQEKIEALGDSWSWWDMKREPKDFTDSDNVFIVCAGKVHGYFTVNHILHEGDYENAKAILKTTLDMINAVGIPMGDWIRIVFRSWIPILKIPMKGFQGFRYRKFNYKEKHQRSN